MERNPSGFYKHSNGIWCFPPFLRNPFSAWMLFPSALQPCKQKTALQPMLITATESRGLLGEKQKHEALSAFDTADNLTGPSDLAETAFCSEEKGISPMNPVMCVLRYV